MTERGDSPGRRGGRRQGEEGQVAGIEAVFFGLLVVLVGTLIIANAWGVVDAKFAVSSAAREATRAFVEAPEGSDPLVAAEAAAAEVISGFGRNPERLQLGLESGQFERCARVVFRATYPLPALVLPWIGGAGDGFDVTATHSEVVDPYRSGLAPGDGSCAP